MLNPLPQDEKSVLVSSKKTGFTEILIGKRVFLREEVHQFQGLISRALNDGETRFLINFHDCQYISSEGLGAVAEFWRTCSESEHLKMVALFKHEPVNELLSFFEIIGLTRVMDGHVFTHPQSAREFLVKTTSK